MLDFEKLRFHENVKHKFIIEGYYDGIHYFTDYEFKDWSDALGFIYNKFPVIEHEDGTTDDQEDELDSYTSVNITNYYGLVDEDGIYKNIVFGSEEDAEEYSNDQVVDISKFIQNNTTRVDIDLDAMYLKKEVSHG